jgi:hypothetical protein
MTWILYMVMCLFMPNYEHGFAPPQSMVFAQTRNVPQLPSALYKSTPIQTGVPNGAHVVVVVGPAVGAIVVVGAAVGVIVVVVVGGVHGVPDGQLQYPVYGKHPSPASPFRQYTVTPSHEVGVIVVVVVGAAVGAIVVGGTVVGGTVVVGGGVHGVPDGQLQYPVYGKHPSPASPFRQYTVTPSHEVGAIVVVGAAVGAIVVGGTVVVG